MIDWEMTKSKYGSIDLSKYRPKVVVRCDKCSKSSDYIIRVKSRLINNNISWLCIRCACNKDSVKSKLSVVAKQAWASEDYIAKQKEKSRRLWGNKDYVDKHHDSVNSKENRRKCSEAAIRAWSDDDYRKKHAVSLAKQLRVIPNTERKVHSILDDLGVVYSVNHVVGPYTFDIIIRRDGVPDLLLEVNGNYWHTRPQVARKDLAKSVYISGLGGYELKTLWEHQLFDLDRCKQLLCYWLGLGGDRRVISLKDVVFSVCGVGEMREFMGNFHYLGSMGRAGVHVCGMVGGEMVCGMVLAHPTRREVYSSLGFVRGEVLELSRFCISPYVRCRNLASFALSKLVSFVPCGVRCLVSFASPGDGHDGTIYRAANWGFVGDTVRSYFYVNDDGWKLHKKTLYNQARGMHLRESEFAERFGYRKIWLPPLKKFMVRI